MKTAFALVLFGTILPALIFAGVDRMKADDRTSFLVQPGGGRIVDAAAGDYRLRIDSPCRSKGRNDDWMMDALDVYGKPRLIGRKVDIGAAETESGLTLLVR